MRRGHFAAGNAALAVAGVSPALAAKVRTFRSLYDIPNGSDVSGLLADNAGNLYGTTSGSGTCCGTVYELAAGRHRDGALCLHWRKRRQDPPMPA
ncbi:MAG: hypothetical protein WDN04_24980 [Rhodospirillales bacterium]